MITVKSPAFARPPPPLQRLNIDRCISRQVNKGKMHKITISSNLSGPCGKLGSTKLGVQELEVDNIVLD